MQKKEVIRKFIDIYVPTELCNLRCHYCYITQKRKFNNKIAQLSHSPKVIRQALSKERLGGVCLLNLCSGGETLLSDDVLPVVKQLLEEGHYVMIVTNGTITKRFEEVSVFPIELRKRLFFKFSFHYLEMKRLNMMDSFFSNVALIKKSKISFTVEITPSDELVPFIDDVKKICMENLGALCHVTIARNDRLDGIDILSNYSFEEYKNIWGTFDSKLFEFKAQLYQKHISEFCYAGEWSAYLNIESGDMRQCYCGKVIDNIYKEINKPLHFEAIGCKCSFAYCYNGHAWLALGDVPTIDSITYAEERNRICVDGTEWLQPEMKAFMSTKLFDDNIQFSEKEKHLINQSNKINFLRRLKKKILKFITLKIKK